MQQMQSADANLLIALDALLRDGSVTAAARRMHITPPAMSHTLARLRDALGDPLFVRAGNRLVATPRALARTFVIRASDATIVILGPALELIVRREAPRVALHFVGSPPPDRIEID